MNRGILLHLRWNNSWNHLPPLHWDQLINNQHRATRREFELVKPTLLKNPLGAGWGLQPTLRWVGSWLPTYLASFHQVERDFTAGIEPPTTSSGKWEIKIIYQSNTHHNYMRFPKNPTHSNHMARCSSKQVLTMLTCFTAGFVPSMKLMQINLCSLKRPRWSAMLPATQSQSYYHCL